MRLGPDEPVQREMAGSRPSEVRELVDEIGNGDVLELRRNRRKILVSWWCSEGARPRREGLTPVTSSRIDGFDWSSVPATMKRRYVLLKEIEVSRKRYAALTTKRPKRDMTDQGSRRVRPEGWHKT